MTGRVVLVVGASSGIGAATAALLAGRGERVVGVARSAESLARLRDDHCAERTFVADVLDGPALTRIVTDVVCEQGRLDAVVHTASVMAYGSIEDVPPATFERVVDTAIHGTANLARAVLPQFRAQHAGTFIIVNSLLGQIATPRMGAYDVGKWGQLGLARVLRLEARDVPGINICTVSPGAVNTPIYDQAANYAGRAGFPPPPVAGPERVAAAIAGLLERPRRHANVGVANTPTEFGFRYAPWLYECLVGPLVARLVFRGTTSEANDGNVFSPIPRAEQAHGRWSVTGRVTRPGQR